MVRRFPDPKSGSPFACQYSGVFQALCERWKNNCEHLPVLLQNYLFFHGLHSAAVSAACL